MGAGGAREEVCKASLTPVTISGQEGLLTEKKCRGRDGGRADVCFCTGDKTHGLSELFSAHCGDLS